jgi:hypothetical protein
VTFTVYRTLKLVGPILGNPQTILTSIVQTDMERSFFVGDAAGRAGDHSDTDRKWAINASLDFYVPEELFKCVDPILT